MLVSRVSGRTLHDCLGEPHPVQNDWSSLMLSSLSSTSSSLTCSVSCGSLCSGRGADSGSGVERPRRRSSTERIPIHREFTLEAPFRTSEWSRGDSSAFKDGPGRDRTCDLGIKSPAFQQNSRLGKTPLQAIAQAVFGCRPRRLRARLGVIANAPRAPHRRGTLSPGFSFVESGALMVR